MQNIEIKFRGIDTWNRPVFKDINSKSHYGSTCRLFSFEADEESVLSYFRYNLAELEYFGEHFGCEPHGGLNADIKFILVE